MPKVQGNVAAERAVLAGLCQYGQRGLIDVNDLIDINTFYNESNQLIFKCLEHVLSRSEMADIPSFLAAATELGMAEALSSKEDVAFVNALFRLPIKLDNVRKYATQIKKLEIARMLQGKLKEAYDSLGETTGTEGISEILSIAEEPVFNMSNDINKGNDEEPKKLFEDVEPYLDHLVANPTDMIGISTPFPIYDEAIGGGQRRGSVNLIVARPKVGKTTFAKEVALHVAGKLSIPVLMLDTEMSRHDQINRSIASRNKIKTRSIETGQFGSSAIDKEKVYHWTKSVSDMPYFYKKVAGKPFPEILSIIRRWLVRSVGLDENGNTNDCLIIYDYFKLMDKSDLDTMQEYQAMGYQIQDMTNFCTLNEIPCLAFVQANRDGAVKETAEIISQSDRLLWACGSACLFKKKTDTEVMDDGPENGNMKLIPLDLRFGAGLTDSYDYINMVLYGDISLLEEINTKKQSIKASTSGHIGFDIEDSETVSEADDETEVPFK